MNEAQLNRVGGVRSRTSLSTAALWWPVIGASLGIAAFSVAVSVVRTLQVYPHDPWESIIVADAYRASVGLPVYTDPAMDHSTHIYGPLIFYTVGLIFKVTGVNLIAGRVVALLATIWIIAALAVIYFRRLPWIFAPADTSSYRHRPWSTPPSCPAPTRCTPR